MNYNYVKQFDMLKSLELNYNDYIDLMSHAQKLKIDFMSTPYSFEDVDFLMKLNVDAFKIASGQLTELPFLDYSRKRRSLFFYLLECQLCQMLNLLLILFL